MRTISVSLSFSILASLCLAQTMPATAQMTAPTNWEAKQQNTINQEAASGVINSKQAAALQRREAQIQAQQQQYLNQNGGTLTTQQKHQIDSELRSVNKHLNSDVKRNAAQTNPAGVPLVAPAWQNSAQRQWQQWPNNAPPQQWQNNVPPQQLQNANQTQWQSQQNGAYHHHHHNHNADGANGNSGTNNADRGWHN